MYSDNERSRYQRRTKKRKTNVLLNSLIGIVLLLIIIVSASIFLGNNDEEEGAANKEELKAEEKVESEETEGQEPTEADEEEEVTDEKEEEGAETVPSNKEVEEEETAGEDTTNTSPETEEPVVTEGGNDDNVIRTIVNPAWEPIGTVQTGEHVNTYDGVDWDEMVDAISYATGLSEDQMTIHFLGNNGHNKSVGTIYTKGKAQIYRVYIEWVNGEGWKPTMIEELSAIEKKEETTTEEGEA